MALNEDDAILVGRIDAMRKLVQARLVGAVGTKPEAGPIALTSAEGLTLDALLNNVRRRLVRSDD